MTTMKTERHNLNYQSSSYYTKINLTKEWPIYFKIPSRIFKNVNMQELRKDGNRQINN